MVDSAYLDQRKFIPEILGGMYYRNRERKMHWERRREMRNRTEEQGGDEDKVYWFWGKVCVRVCLGGGGGTIFTD
jgi:hypothetical protein